MIKEDVTRRRTRGALTFALGLLAMFAFAVPANATLNLLQPDPSVPATFTGNAGFSSDGLGQTSPGGSVQAEVPAGSTVEYAYLYGTYFDFTETAGGPPDVSLRTIDFDGTDVVLDYLTNSEPGDCCGLATARAEVTDQVAAKVGSGGGITDFVIGNDPIDFGVGLDGVALVVIYSNPALPVRSIAVLDGGSKQSGDTATVNLQDPIDTSEPGFSVPLALGSGFSFQDGGPASNACGPFTNGPQFSTVQVNGDLLTSCAGNYDDGEPANGALITVGGVGDSLDNPADPTTQTGTDDELYELAPFLNDGDTSITIDTANPSSDDNLFLAVFQVPGAASIQLEGPPGSPTCSDGIDNDGDGDVDSADGGCQAVEGPPGDATCSDFADNDGDGQVDQADSDCQSPEGPAGSASCSDGVDNDGDGDTDAADSDCQEPPTPEGPAGDPTCSDGIDNDGDGLVDSDDPDCQTVVPPGAKCFGQDATITGNGVVNGTPGDDVIITGNGADTVRGLGGDDLICSTGGDDYVRGGTGNDKVLAGAGADNAGGNAGNDLVRGVGGNDSVQGDGGDDTVRGGTGDDRINGGPGADRLTAGPGDDRLTGGTGAPDTCNGDGGTDSTGGGCEVLSNIP